MAEEYIPKIKPELKISLKDAEDELKYVKPFKQVHISREDESKIEDVLHQRPIPVKRESDKLYNQDHLPTTLRKHKRYNPDSYSDIIVGFKDPRPKFWQSVPVEVEINIPKGTTHKDLFIANADKESGTSNPINQAITQYETKADLDDIKEAEKYVDATVNEEVDKVLAQLHNKRESDLQIIDTKIKSETGKQNYTTYLENKFNKGVSEINEKSEELKKNHKADIKPIIDKIKVEKTIEKNIKGKIEKQKALDKINNIIYNTRQRKNEEAANKLKQEAKQEADLKEQEERHKLFKENILKKKTNQENAESLKKKTNQEIVDAVVKINIPSNVKIPLIEQGLKLIETNDINKTDEIRKLIINAGLGMKLRNTKKFDKDQFQKEHYNTILTF